MITEPTSPTVLMLIATNEYGATFRYKLEHDRGVFIGRSGNCGLQLPDKKLADIHCRIGLNDGKLRIQNWMSSEGTLVNGREINSETEIALTDVIQIGTHKIRVSTASTDEDKSNSKESLKNGPTNKSAAEFHGTTSAKAPVMTHAAERFLRDDDSDELEHDEMADLHADETRSLLGDQTIDLLKPRRDSGIKKSEATESDQLTADENSEFGFTFETEAETMDLDSDFFGQEDEQTFDRETVALLQAEIDDLRAALANRDAECSQDSPNLFSDFDSPDEESPDDVLHRMEQLIEEANRSDERVSILEEMLHAAEDTNRSEREERNQLEAWVRDIETRIGQREDEHHAEVDVLKVRLQEAVTNQERLQKQLRQTFAGTGDSAGNAAGKQVDEMLETLQRRNRELQESLAQSQKQCTLLEQRLASSESGQDETLRAERAKLAKEQAKVSRLRYELSSKLAEIEQSSKSDNRTDLENGQRIRALREHLREIHEQEQHEAKESSLVTRLTKLWKRVES